MRLLPLLATLLVTACAVDPVEDLGGAWASSQALSAKDGTDTVVRIDLAPDSAARWQWDVTYPRSSKDFAGCRLETFFVGSWSIACTEQDAGAKRTGCVKLDFLRGLRQRTGCDDTSRNFAFESVDVAASRTFFEKLAYEREDEVLRFGLHALGRGCTGCDWPPNL